jgi:hypothetical protein
MPQPPHVAVVAVVAVPVVDFQSRERVGESGCPTFHTQYSLARGLEEQSTE